MNTSTHTPAVSARLNYTDPATGIYRTGQLADGTRTARDNARTAYLDIAPVTLAQSARLSDVAHYGPRANLPRWARGIGRRYVTCGRTD